MLRKVDNSEGAGLNGGGKDDVEEVLVVGLAGGLPELFLGFGIVTALCRRTSWAKATTLMAIGNSRPDLATTSTDATIKKYASAKRASHTEYTYQTTTTMSQS